MRPRCDETSRAPYLSVHVVLSTVDIKRSTIVRTSQVTGMERLPPALIVDTMRNMSPDIAGAWYITDNDWDTPVSRHSSICQA